MSVQTHIAILGAGPGGYVAAIRAAQLGARVTVIESQALGGVCLNWGCIPSKALLSVVELGEKVKKAGPMGLQTGPITYDLQQMVARKNQVVAGLVKGIATLFKTWDIEHLHGMGTIQDRQTVGATLKDGAERPVNADAIVIATGSSWPNLPQFPIDGSQILTSQQLLGLMQIPPRLLIIGGGVEGCECASLYSALGTDVTVVELMDRILPCEDEDTSSAMTRELKKRNVNIMTGTTVERLERGEKKTVTAHLKDGTVLEVEKLLVSVGRGFNSRGIGLERVGVQTGRRGEILINEQMETSTPGIYAIGDVTGKAMLAHVASAQGKAAVENIMGHRTTIRYDVIPAGIFTLPEIGRVGLTESQAREWAEARGGDPSAILRIGRFRYTALGKAQATGETTGWCKVIAEASSGRILGVHMIGAHAADLIHEAALAMQVGATVAQVAEMIHAHPTLAEGFMEAAEDAEGKAIHQVRKKVG